MRAGCVSQRTQEGWRQHCVLLCTGVADSYRGFVGDPCAGDVRMELEDEA